MKIKLFIFFLLALLAATATAQPGANDPTFNPGDLGFGFGDGANGYIFSTAIQSNGRIIIGGYFTSYHGTGRNRIARLNANGTIDNTFNPGTGANFVVLTIAVQPDGKIIIGGGFTSYNGTSRNYIARLNANGTLDNTFNPGTGANNSVETIALQPDGKIIIGGHFTFFNGTSRNRIARLNTNGTIDNTFNPGSGANHSIFVTALQPDGKIIIGGDFSSYNGTSINRIARLNADGTLDSTFNPGSGANTSVSAIALQPDGKIIIGGNFSSYNGTSTNRIARLNADGTLDNTFNPGSGANGSLNDIVLQTDGRIIIGGDFTSYNGTSINRIARLNADGTLDITFNPGTGASNSVSAIALQPDEKIIIVGFFSSYNTIGRRSIVRINENGTLDNTLYPGTGASNRVYATTLQPDGKIIIGGSFSSFNGTSRNCIARLNADGTLDNTFNPGTGANNQIFSTALQPDGKIIIGGSFTSYSDTSINRIARLNADGTLDNTFNPGTGANNQIFSTALQPDGKIIIGGSFTSFNGTSRNYIARLQTDGALDSTFLGTGTSNTLSAIALQPDGKIIIGGTFNSYNGTTINQIARLNSDGTLDNTFNPGTGPNNTVLSIALQPDGKIIIAGNFASYNGTTITRIARINENGTLDTTFNPGTGANSFIYTIALQPDGKIIIGGDFTSYNSIGMNHIARLNADGSLDNTFNPGVGASSSVLTTSLLPDGKIIIGGDFTSYNGIGRNRIARLLDGFVGIETSQKQNIKLYPNPTDGLFVLRFETELTDASLKITDMTGSVIHFQYLGNLSEFEYHLTGAAGLYFIEIISQQGRFVRKIVKE